MAIIGPRSVLLLLLLNVFGITNYLQMYSHCNVTFIVNISDHTNQLLTLIWFSFVRKDDQCVMLGLQTVWRLGVFWHHDPNISS